MKILISSQSGQFGQTTYIKVHWDLILIYDDNGRVSLAQKIAFWQDGFIAGRRAGGWSMLRDNP